MKQISIVLFIIVLFSGVGFCGDYLIPEYGTHFNNEYNDLSTQQTIDQMKQRKFEMDTKMRLQDLEVEQQQQQIEIERQQYEMERQRRQQQ
jgi:hypothetical protein